MELETAYTTTFAGTNGVRYRAQVTTTSEQPLKSSQANLAAVVSPAAIASTEGNMPYGSPIITASDSSPASTTQIDFSVKANGRPIEDGIMLCGGSNQNFYPYTTPLLASTRTPTNDYNGNASYGANAVYAPFNTYQKLDGNGAAVGAPTNFAYVVTNQTTGPDNSYLTLVSGEDGHFSADSSATLPGFLS